MGTGASAKPGKGHLEQGNAGNPADASTVSKTSLPDQPLALKEDLSGQGEDCGSAKKSSLHERRGLFVGIDTHMKPANMALEDFSAWQASDGFCRPTIVEAVGLSSKRTPKTVDKEQRVSEESNDACFTSAADVFKFATRVKDLRRAKTVPLPSFNRDLLIQPVKLAGDDCPLGPKRDCRRSWELWEMPGSPCKSPCQSPMRAFRRGQTFSTKV